MAMEGGEEGHSRGGDGHDEGREEARGRPLSGS